MKIAEIQHSSNDVAIWRAEKTPLRRHTQRDIGVRSVQKISPQPKAGLAYFHFPTLPIAFWTVGAFAAPVDYDVLHAFWGELGFTSAELVLLIVPLWLSTLGCYLLSEKRPHFTFWALLLITGLLSSLLAEILPLWSDPLLLPVSLVLIALPRWWPLNGLGEWPVWLSLLPVFTLGTVLESGIATPFDSWTMLPLFGTCGVVAFIGYRTQALPAAIAFWIGCLLVRPIGSAAEAQIVSLFSELGNVGSRAAISAIFALIIAGSIFWSLAVKATVSSVDAGS